VNDRRRLLLISGSLRAGSTNAAALATAATVTPDDVDAVVYEGMADLPHFNPDDDRDPLDPAVADLRSSIASSDAVLFCTPEYAGALPGSFKNLLDWTVGDGETTGKRVGWINISAAGGALGAHESLGVVARYTDFHVVDDACVNVPVGRADIGDDGLVTDSALRRQIADAVATLLG